MHFNQSKHFFCFKVRRHPSFSTAKHYHSLASSVVRCKSSLPAAHNMASLSPNGDSADGGNGGSAMFYITLNIEDVGSDGTAQNGNGE